MQALLEQLMNKLSQLYIRLTEILKIQLYLKKENEQLTRQINKEKLKEENVKKRI